MNHSFRRSCIAIFVALCAAGPALAADSTCTIHPPNGTSNSALKGMTKVTESDARTTALARFANGSAEIAESELEVERGCLVYSFDVRVKDRAGIDEIQIDAGSGHVVSHKHETAAQEAAEAAQDSAKRPAQP